MNNASAQYSPRADCWPLAKIGDDGFGHRDCRCPITIAAFITLSKAADGFALIARQRRAALAAGIIICLLYAKREMKYS